MAEPVLHRFTDRPSGTLVEQIVAGTEPVAAHQEPVVRHDGDPIGIGVLDHLMTTAVGLRDDRWSADPVACDAWLAPRLHYALRLTRAEAGDRRLWAWLSVRYSDHVAWRWTAADGTLNPDRWTGPIHKQALMRLWWGAELFRDGPDYTPVERAFRRQDLPNSYLHRPLVRCRSLALALTAVIAPDDLATTRTSDEI